jgi:hypothetical protein
MCKMGSWRLAVGYPKTRTLTLDLTLRLGFCHGLCVMSRTRIISSTLITNLQPVVILINDGLVQHAFHIVFFVILY